ALGSRPPRSPRAGLVGPIVIRYSRESDQTALERLALLDSRRLPPGSFLLAMVAGELVAAAPLEIDAEPLSDPFRPTEDIRQLLPLRGANIRRRYEASASRGEAACRGLPGTA